MNPVLELDLLLASHDELPPEIGALADAARRLAILHARAEAAAAGAVSVPRARSEAADRLLTAAIAGEPDVVPILIEMETAIRDAERTRGYAVVVRAASERAQHRLRAALSDLEGGSP